MPDALPPPRPGYSALRKNRWSAPGTEYFVTFKAEHSVPELARPDILAALTEHREGLQASGHWVVRTWVVMPDHIHMLFTLGEVDPLSECLRKFKGRLTPFLRRKNVHWQAGYFEHRMRPEEDRLPIFLYVFLNPYRTKLLPLDATWPGYFCAADDWMWFEPLTRSSAPFPEWL